MRFTWHETKNETNIAKHGIDFADVTAAFDGPMLVGRTDRDGELRFIGIGKLGAQPVTVIWTVRGAVYRLISARAATQREVRRYEAGYPPAG